MALSWNEIRTRALKFSKDWEGEGSEVAEAQSFINDFFNIFGVARRRVATFEKQVTKIDGKDGRIDLIWKGVLLIEQKSRGKDLDRAYSQAIDYFPGLKERDLPRYILVSDFARFRLYDLETGEQYEFLLAELHKNIKLFGFIAGYLPHAIKPEDPANIKAAEMMGKLHDQLKAVGYEGHVLELYLVRLLFCMFAEDTSIFERQQFKEYIETKTAEDGNDLGHHLSTLFYILNTPDAKRLRNLDEHLAAFPYVNGRLFEENLPPAQFDLKMRQALLECCGLDWSRISPAIFGSLFQSVMDDKLRRNLGAHYTTEQNILKLIRPLFLDELHEEFERVRHSTAKLLSFQRKLANLKFLDPACGCGNFLVITYRELRLLELQVLRALYKDRSDFLNISEIIWLDVDQFYGIELEEFPAQIAQVALWMVDHQMNMRVSEEFGQYFRRLPLKKSPNIIHGNALRLDWKEMIRPEELSYILGNPPFVGKQHQNEDQKADMTAIFDKVDGSGILDYVSAWYIRAVQYMQASPHIKAAFVSTNSITQGEQVGVLWRELMQRYGIHINFAHRTFKWSSEARGKAAVHCVIIGFALFDAGAKIIFDYETPDAEPHELRANNINPYIVDAPDLFLPNRKSPLCNVPEIVFGNMPNDGGNLLLNDEDKKTLLSIEPLAEKWIKPFLGADEFINGIRRWCLWLPTISPQELKALPEVSKRVAAVKKYREGSRRDATKKLANYPYLFGEMRQPQKSYILIPRHSSENRNLIPVGFIDPSIITGDSCLMIPNANLYHFGILTSAMHMSWVRHVCGRLESRYRYSNSLVYNNYPWTDPTDKQKEVIEQAAQRVLNARAKFPESNLADLYDPLTMPAELTKAHAALDRAVDAAYGKTNFRSEAERVAFLFERYLALTSLFPVEKTKAKTKRKNYSLIKK